MFDLQNPNRLYVTLMLSAVLFIVALVLLIVHKYGSTGISFFEKKLQTRPAVFVQNILRILILIEVIYLFFKSSTLFPGLAAGAGFLFFWPFLAASAFVAVKSYKAATEPILWFFVLLGIFALLSRIALAAL